MANIGGVETPGRRESREKKEGAKEMIVKIHLVVQRAHAAHCPQFIRSPRSVVGFWDGGSWSAEVFFCHLLVLNAHDGAEKWKGGDAILSTSELGSEDVDRP
jgi:hypothetical protein